MKSMFAVLLATVFAALAEQTITVEAGNYDRRDCVVEFQLPANVKPKPLLSVDGGRSIPLQIEPDGRASFIEPELKRGTKKLYTFSDGIAPIPVREVSEKGSVTLSAFGRAQSHAAFFRNFTHRDACDAIAERVEFLRSAL